MDSVERTYSSSVRVKIPIRMLYPTMRTVDELIRFFPLVEDYTADSTGTRAACRVGLRVGPVTYRLDASLSVDSVDTPQSLRITLRVPALRLEILGAVTFAASSAGETTLRYTATINSTHPLARRLRGVMANVLEDHVDSATDLIVRRARQYNAASRFRAGFGDHR